MASDDQGVLPRPSIWQLALELFMRAVAAASLALGLYYWLRLVGFYDAPQWRFDTMASHWQVAAVSLAVLYPFAASGLWMLASWGPVVWFLCAAAETAMYAGWPELFGRADLLLALHGLTALVYVGFRIRRHLEARGK